MNTGTSDRLKTPLFPVLTVIAAFSAFGLLPVAMLLGTTNIAFLVISYVHIAFFATASIFAILYFVRQVLATGSSPILPLCLFIIFCILTLLNASPPPTNPSSLSGPLYTIKYWLANESMTPIAWNYDSFAPHLPSLAQAIFLPLVGHMSFPIYSLLTLIITSAAVGLLSYRQTRSSLMATYGFLLFFTLPLFQKLSVDYSLDGSLALYATLGIIYLLRWVQNEQPVRALVALGIVLGALGACGFRGLGLATLLIASLPLLAFSKRVSGGRLLLALLLVPALAAPGILPWLGRNIMWTMNPIFPLASSFLGASGAGVIFQSIEPVLITSWYPALHYTYFDLVMLPLKYVIPDPATGVLLGAKLSPLLLLAVLAFTRFKNVAVFVPIAIVIIYFICSLALFPPNTAALTPIVSILCYLTIVGLDRAGQWCKQYYRLLAHLLLGIHAVFALFFALELITDIRPFAFLQGKDEQKYLQSKIEEFPIITRLNRTLPPIKNSNTELTLYLIGVSPSFYYYDVDIRKDSTDRPDYLIKQLAAHSTADELRSSFIHQGMQVIFARKQTIQDTIEALTLPSEKRLWQSFESNHLETLFEDETFIVWKVLGMRAENELISETEGPEDADTAVADNEIEKAVLPDPTSAETPPVKAHLPEPDQEDLKAPESEPASEITP